MNNESVYLREQAYALQQMKKMNDPIVKGKYVFSNILEYYILNHAHYPNADIDNRLHEITKLIMIKPEVKKFMSDKKLPFIDMNYLSDLFIYIIINDRLVELNNLNDLLEQFDKNYYNRKQIMAKVDNYQIPSNVYKESYDMLKH